MDRPLQGGRRCWNIPHCHHHNQFTHHRLYCPPRRWRQKRKTLALYFPMAKFLSRLHENLLRYIIYHAVLPFTQLGEVSYHSWMQGGRSCWKIPHYHHHNQSQHHWLYYPPCQRHQKQKTLAENIINECIRDHPKNPKSRLHIFHPHNVWQWWSGELAILELQFRIRSGTNLGIRRCYFVKLKHLHCPHHRLIIHLPHPCGKCQSNGRIHQATVDNGGVRIVGTSALWWLTTSMMNKARQNHWATLVQDLPAMCASVYHQILNLQGGAMTAELTPTHRIGWMTEASFQPQAQGGSLTRQQEALLPWWVASIQRRAASLQWHAASFQSQATLFSSSWWLSLFQWRAAEFSQWVADFQWWVRELVQVTRQGVQSMLPRGIG